MRKLRLIFGLSLALVAGPSVADGLYEVTMRQGDVRVWRRFGANWTAVEVGDRLVVGELVQMGERGTLALRGVQAGPNEAVPRSMVLKSDEPLLTRVDPEAQRQVELGGYFVDVQGAVPESVAKRSEPPEGEAPPVRSMRGAWERLLSLFDDAEGEGDESPVRLAARAGGDGQSGPIDEAREIVINHPRDGDTYMVESLPTDVAVSWTSPSPDVKSLRVSFWRADRGSQRPVGQTSETYYPLKIRAPGRYYVSVESPDGRWRSKPHLFIVLPLDELERRSQKATEGE